MRNARVSYYVRVSTLAYQYVEETDPEMIETVNFLLKDQSKDKWTVTPLNINELKSTFSLCFWCDVISAIILALEILLQSLNSLLNSVLINLINFYLVRTLMIF